MALSECRTRLCCLEWLWDRRFSLLTSMLAGFGRASSEGEAMILPLVVHEAGFEVSEKRLLDGVSFQTGAGPRTVVLGPNGAGKSLLLRLCHGLLWPSAGSITWGG